VAQTNIIELNGKQYDADTGTVLGAGRPVTTTAQPLQLRSRHGRIDDFIRPDHRSGQAHIAAAHAPKVAPIAPEKTKTAPKPDIAHVKYARQAAAKPLVAHQPQKSQILMRRSVKKPDLKMKTAIKTQAPAELAARPVSTVVPKASAYQVNPTRVHRAQNTPRSPHVARFAANTHTTSHIAHTAQHTAPVLARSAVAARPAIAQPISRSQVSSAHRPSNSAAHATTAPKAHTDIFEAALARANSHTQPAPKVKAKVKRRSSHRWLKVGAGVFVLLAIGGAVLWVNRTTIAVHMASSKVGFAVNLPGYAPSGYALTGGIQAANGKVTTSFRSGSAQYVLTQQASPWDSNTLRDSMVALASGTSQTIKAAGRTVYLYGQGDATWVDGGVRYDLATNNNLSSSEIANLVASI